MAEIAQSHDALLNNIARTTTAPGQAAFWWLGQHTFVVKAGDKVIYIDPWFAPWPSRQTAPLLTAEAVTNADWILVTHGHGDHLCPETLPGLATASSRARFVSPKTEAGRMRDEGKVPDDCLILVTAGDVIEQDGVKITAIKSKHEAFDEHPTLGFPYLGYVVETNGMTFYHAGDTINYEGLLTTLRQWPHFDAAFLPINGRDAERFLSGCIGNMTYQEAVETAGELNVGLAVPAHYDMFVGNQEDPSKFVRFLEAKYPGVRSWVGPAGTKVVFGRE